MAGPRGTEAVESGHVVAYRTTGNDGCYETGSAIGALTTSTDPNSHVVTVGTLRAHHPGTAGVQSDTDHIVAFDTTQISSPHNYSNPQPGDPCHPLAAGAHPPAVAIDAAHAFKVRGGCEGGGKGYLGSDEVAFTLSTNQDQHIFSEATHEVAGTFKACAGSGGWSNSVDHAAAGYMALVPTAAYLKKQKPLDPYLGGEVTIAIDASYSKGCGGTSAAERPVVASNSTVRRLTPVECERLQGFPDNFTAIPWGKKEAADCPDGPRYKALGNSMAVPVMRWIGERINTVDDLISVL